MNANEIGALLVLCGLIVFLLGVCVGWVTGVTWCFRNKVVSSDSKFKY